MIKAAVELASPPLVVVDEAYFEFVGSSVLSWSWKYPNVLAVRRLSKAFALAGIRVGYGVGSRSVIERLERVRPPGSISTISAHMAAAALRSPAYAIEDAAALSKECEWLAAELNARG